MSDYDKILEYLETELEKHSRKKGGPRSTVIDVALVLLLSKPMRSAEIAKVIGVESKYISSYLSYWKTRGYLEYSNGLWYLTPLGEDYAKSIVERTVATRFQEYVAIAKQILESRGNVTKNNKKKRSSPPETSHLLSFIVTQTNKLDKKQQNPPVFSEVDGECAFKLLEPGLNQDEREVVKILTDNYSQWGSSYMYLDQIQEKLEAEPIFLLKVLRDLQTKQIIYIYNDPRLGIRVGFTKKIKQYIEDLCRTRKT